jgi:hypothetical protein
VEQGAVEAARGAVVDVLDDGVLAQPGIAQPGGQALIAAMRDLAIEQQPQLVQLPHFGDQNPDISTM